MARATSNERRPTRAQALVRDERLELGADTEERLDRDVDNLANRDALGDPDAITDEEWDALFQDSWLTEHLPKLPEIQGYHLCWLSTTNSYDPIHKRMRLGYRAVRPGEIQGFSHLVSQNVQYGDVVACNEMILFKIPTRLYERIMMHFHHNQPLLEEQAITARIEGLKNTTRDSRGNPLIKEEGDGLNALGKEPAKRPTFPT